MLPAIDDLLVHLLAAPDDEERPAERGDPRHDGVHHEAELPHPEALAISLHHDPGAEEDGHDLGK